MAHKTNNHYAVEQKPRTPRQLEIFPDDPAFYPETAPGWPEDEIESRESRKSPAAAFGSRQIGAVVLPKQLQSSVSRLIEGKSVHLPRHINLILMLRSRF